MFYFLLWPEMTEYMDTNVNLTSPHFESYLPFMEFPAKMDAWTCVHAFTDACLILSTHACLHACQPVHSMQDACCCRATVQVECTDACTQHAVTVWLHTHISHVWTTCHESKHA